MRLFLLSIATILIGPLSVCKAQNEGYFMSNGKNVEIGAFNREMEKMIRDVGIPAVSVAIIDDNKVVFSNAYGYKQLSAKDKVDPNTVFEACSLSKSYLVYVVFKLVDEGKFDLDKPICQYMEPGPILDHDPRYKLITSRMILSHCSGIENWDTDNIRDTLEIVADPGKKFVYSSTGYNYLAAAVEKVLGEPYEIYVRKMILEPFKLTGTYLQFTAGDSSHKESPSNYAIGHDNFGKEIPKWKNQQPVPSSANNITAEDYAKLIIAIFDRQHLSAKAIKAILTPGIPTNDKNWPYYYGPGFELFFPGSDTIIGHGGNNSGFKCQIFYSVTNRRGFVFIANSDLGKLMTEKICALTAGLDINKYYEQFSPEQYPSPSIDLFKIYREQNGEAMWKAINDLKGRGGLGAYTLSELGDLFIEHDPQMAKRLIEENITLFPGASLSYIYLGDIYRKSSRYDSAYACYAKAKELHFEWWPIEDILTGLTKKIQDGKRREALVANIGANEKSVVRAENYNSMSDIDIMGAADTGGGHAVGYIEKGSWMDYKVNVAASGTYSVDLRVASPDGDAQLELLSGSTVLTKVGITPTMGWQKWATVTTSISLAAGSQTLRIYADTGGFNINWLQFSKIAGGGSQ